MKKIIFSVLILALTGLVVYTYQHLPIINGYAAKMACSCVFVSNRPLDNVVKDDLDLDLVRLAEVTIDKEAKTATATIKGMGGMTAVYREGLGCTLVTGTKTVEDLKKEVFTPLPTLPTRPDTIDFPIGTRMPRTLPKGINQVALTRIIEPFFDTFNEEPFYKTKAILVLKRGQLVYERYANGINQNTPLISWSMAKSITNALVGRMVMQGKVNINEPIAIADWKKDERAKITLNNLLQMSSGLDWDERYDGISDATNMLYTAESLGKFASQSAIRNAPDAEWYYSSGTTNIISEYLRQQFDNQEEYLQFPRQELFNKIGMRSAIMEPDAGGTFVGSSYVFATARDWARLGLLYANDGVWNGERLLPEGWVKYSTTPAPASGGEYGAHIWLNAGGVLPKLPRDMYYFSGFEEQRVFVFPSQDLVVVRLGTAPDGRMDFDKLLRSILLNIDVIGDKNG